METALDRTISLKDNMYNRGQDTHYFLTGYSALKNINLGLAATGISCPTNILDMACGYGRVMRMFKAYFPAARLTACDIDPDAVDFCAETFGADKVYSDKNFEQIRLPDTFDLIWCGSLLTHLDIPHWKSFINFCAAHLQKRGLLAFTTHGRYAVKMITDYDFYYGLGKSRACKLVNDYMESGFGYCDYPSESGCGISVASPSWVVSFIEEHSELEICSIIEMGWGDHQDVYCYRHMRDPVKEVINEYGKELMDYIMLRLDKTRLRTTHYSRQLREEVAGWIEVKMSEDNMPFGPRVRHILTSVTLDRITGE